MATAQPRVRTMRARSIVLVPAVDALTVAVVAGIVAHQRSSAETCRSSVQTYRGASASCPRPLVYQET